jgi:hypothetical protein
MKLYAIVFLVINSLILFAQDSDVDEEAVQLLEHFVEKNEEAGEELQVEDFHHFNKHPINLNKASAEELSSSQLLTDLQVNYLLLYRKMLGSLIHIYELQAVPGFDSRSIQRILPYITINEAAPASNLKAIKEGEHVLIVRYGQTLEASKGLRDGNYLGSPKKISVRYRFRYKNAVSWGISGEKDAGEPFLRYAQRGGFDFYGFHLFKTSNGFLKALALGDYTANMGQGLIHWQGLAFKKSAAVINIKRQSPVLRPYTSTGETEFMRGAGVTIRKNKLAATAFISWRKLSVNLTSDSGDGRLSISSFLRSGLHRTAREIADRKAAGRFSTGSVFRFAADRFQLSLNTIYHHFSHPLLKRDEPYNLFALKGKSFLNNSIDYSYTYKNMHVFGEIAGDHQLSTAIIQGLMLSPDPKLDAAFLYRRITRKYQSVSGNAFTENSLPANEQGFYTAIVFRISNTVSIDGYIDIFRFPWLKYRVNAGSHGKDYLLSIAFRPDKKTECYSRFTSSLKSINRSRSGEAIDPLLLVQKLNWRTNLLLKINRQFTLQNRFEVSSYKAEGEKRQEGCILFADMVYKPPFRNWSAHTRLQYFSIDSYEARIYAYESGVAGQFSIPAFHGQGKRYLFNLNYQFLSTRHKWKILCSALLTQTFYVGSESIGSGLDEIKGSRRSDFSIQLKVTRS